eukprot:m.277731 g.277731  ORF g.277731 m.277731 type:complete len:64 (+) comp40610_c0_seq3:1540-1731(+)
MTWHSSYFDAVRTNTSRSPPILKQPSGKTFSNGRKRQINQMQIHVVQLNSTPFQSNSNFSVSS